MKFKVENIIEIDNQRIIDAFNKLNEADITKLYQLTDDEIIESVENTDDIMVDLLGEDFEGGYVITILDD